MLLDELPLSLRLEVAGGRAATIINAGASLPAVWKEGFTIVDPSQREIPLKLLDAYFAPDAVRRIKARSVRRRGIS